MTNTFQPFGVFLSEMLMDPETVQVYLNLSYRPDLFPSRIFGYRLGLDLNAKSEMYLLVPGKADDSVEGQVWFVETEEDFQKLVAHELRGSMELTDCTKDIKLEKDSPSHATTSYKVFVWTGNREGLVYTTFDIENYELEGKRLLLRNIRRNRAATAPATVPATAPAPAAAPATQPGMARTRTPYSFFVYLDIIDEEVGLLPIFREYDEHTKLINATAADRDIESIEFIEDTGRIKKRPNLIVAPGKTVKGKVFKVKEAQVSDELRDLFPIGYSYGSCDVAYDDESDESGTIILDCQTLCLEKNP